jgi:hypothetical protein
MTPPQKPDRWEYTYVSAVGMGTLGWELVGQVAIYDASRALNMPMVMLKRRLP